METIQSIYSELTNVHGVCNGINPDTDCRDVAWLVDGRVLLDREITDDEAINLWWMLSNHDNAYAYLSDVTPEQFEVDIREGF